MRAALSRVHPYTATASHVPPEMFFGRRHEIEEITNPQGSCFVYGGRQLGKTALLRHIERIFAQRGIRMACWLDLKQVGIHSMDDIWHALGLRLKEAGLPGEPPATLDGLLRHIQDASIPWKTSRSGRCSIRPEAAMRTSRPPCDALSI